MGKGKPQEETRCILYEDICISTFPSSREAIRSCLRLTVLGFPVPPIITTDTRHFPELRLACPDARAQALADFAEDYPMMRTNPLRWGGNLRWANCISETSWWGEGSQLL